MAEKMAVDATSAQQVVETDPETANTGISQVMSKPAKSKVSTSQLVSKEDLFVCFRRKTSNTTKPIALMSRYHSETPLKDLVDTKEHNYKSLLQWAGIRGWSDVCKILIDDHHCDPFYEDDNNWTVLHNVCRNGHIDLVRYFVSTFKMEQLIHKKNKDGTTPLDFSILRHHNKIAEYLISKDPYYIKAIADGSGYLRPAVVVMHGPPGAGKTSVKQMLLGRDPLRPQEQNSTDIIERPIRISTIKSDGNNKLNEINKPTFHKMLLRSILDNRDDIQKNTEAPVSSQPSTSTAVHSSHQQSGTTTISQSDTPFVNPSSTSLVHLKNPEQPLEIDSSRTLKRMKQYLSTAKSSKNVFNFDWIYMVDSGGQPQFSDVLPLLFQSEALYIVVIRLDQDLDDKQNNCYYSNGNENRLPEKLILTNRQIIERTCQIAQVQNSETSPRRVIVIATHIDQVPNPEERVKEFDKELRNIQTKYDKVFVTKDISSDRIIYPVNAMATGAERTAYINELQKCLIKTLKELIKPIQVSLKWFVYQLDLDEESNNTHGVLTKSKCIELGVNLGMKAEEIELSLIFFNMLALHIYHSDFPDMVLIKIDPLIKRLSTLIRSSFDPPKDVPTYEYTKLKQSGLFKKSLLSTTFANIGDGNAISVDDFLRISDCLKVIVPVMNDEYFIPSVLSVDSTIDPIKYQLIPCIINWGDHIVLPWFFNTLIAMLLCLPEDQQSSKNCFTLPTYETTLFQSRDKIKLVAEPPHFGVVTLTNEIKWIGVYYSHNNMESYIAILRIVRQALEEVTVSLKNVLGTVHFSFPSFLCPTKCLRSADSRHPCKFDLKNYQCSLNPYEVQEVTLDMKTIIESIESFPAEVHIPSNGSVLAKRNHSVRISEDESVDTQTSSKKPHCHDEKDDNNMGTRMINEATEESTGNQRKRKTDILEGNSITKKPAFNDDNGKDRTEDNISIFSGQPDYTLVDNKTFSEISSNKDLLDVMAATTSISINDWSVLSLHFGITPAEYDQIKQKVVQGGNLQTEIISRWFQLDNASWSSLVKYLCEVRRYDVAKKIAEVHPSSSQQVEPDPEVDETINTDSDNITRLVSVIKDVFTNRVNYDRLATLLQYSIDSFATEMLQQQLIAPAVSHNPNYTTIVGNFLAKLDVMTDKEKIKQRCEKFLKVLHNIGEQEASEYMKKQLHVVDAVRESRLNIDID